MREVVVVVVVVVCVWGAGGADAVLACYNERHARYKTDATV